MSEFLKAGNMILPKPNGIDYDLKNGQVYNLKYERYNARYFFEEDGDLNLTFKIYNTEEDVKLMNRIVTQYNNSSRQTTGAIFAGVPGTGKTVMAKQIAKKSNLPIIVVQPTTPTGNITDFFTKFNKEVCIIFDEIDKDENHWSTGDLLGFLDGVQSTAKKLVLMTCNNLDTVNKFLRDRCSRIRYLKIFEANENKKFLKELMIDKGITNEEEVNKTYDFVVNNFTTLSIDNIISFIEEKLLFPDLTNEELIEDMNVSLKNTKFLTTDGITSKTVKNTEKQHCECNDDDYLSDKYDLLVEDVL